MKDKDNSKNPGTRTVKPIRTGITSRRQLQKNAAHIFVIKECINRLLPMIHEEEAKEILVKLAEEAAKLGLQLTGDQRKLLNPMGCS